MVVRILQIYLWVSGSRILTHDQCDHPDMLTHLTHDPLSALMMTNIVINTDNYKQYGTR